MKLKYLKSVDLDNIKITKKIKRVLLINPRKQGNEFMQPHNGLAVLAGILKKRGHKVLIVDYAFSKDAEEVDFFIKNFKPDIIGISIYSSSLKEAMKLIKNIRTSNLEIPLIIGGPHVTNYSNSLEKQKEIDYMFIGEAELTIIPVVENAKRQTSPKIIACKEILNLYHVPLPDYKSFYQWQKMTTYAIMTSRGCPNKCSFCANIGLAHRMWRPRKPEECIKELELAKKEISPYLKFAVFDDCPTVHKDRFKNFLRLYIEKIGNELVVVNTRADCIDEELIRLLKKCNIRVLTMGVEHGNPEIFKNVNKGETFEQMELACKLIKKHGMRLGLSFIIGLPGDTLKKTRDSINLYKKLKADQISLNLLVPFRNTPVREWIDHHKIRIYDEFEFGEETNKGISCQKVMFETPEFTKFEREKAFYMFLLEVAEPSLKLRYMPQILSITRKYKLYSEFFRWLPKGIIVSINNSYHRFRYGLFVYHKIGLRNVLRRLLREF